MSRAPRSAVLAVALLATAFSPLAAMREAAPPLDRAGAIRIGDALAPMLQAKSVRPEQAYADGCGFFSGAALPKGVTMMVLDGDVARFDIDAYEAMTGAPNVAGPGPFGIAIGDADAVARRKFPRDVEVRQHAYGGPGDHYLTWYDGTRGHAVRAETLGGTVNRLQWGRSDAVELTEGCS